MMKIGLLFSHVMECTALGALALLIVAASGEDGPRQRARATSSTVTSGKGVEAIQGGQAEIAPNVLLIVLDDVGTDKLEMYGETPEQWPDPGQPYCLATGQTLPAFHYPRTPNLDLLASGQFAGLGGGGVRFLQAYATPVCNTTRACIQTGRYGFRTGMGVVEDAPWGEAELDDSEVLLPELLKAGFAPGPNRPDYRCGAFGKWHLSGSRVCGSSSVQPGAPTGTEVSDDYWHPIDNGYDVFKGALLNLGSPGSNPGDHFTWTKVSSGPSSIHLQRLEVVPGGFNYGCTGSGCVPIACGGLPCGAPPCSEITVDAPLSAPDYDSDLTWSGSVTRRDAVEWINAQNGPFFAHVAFHAPHFPYQMPPLSLLSDATKAELGNVGNCHGPYISGQKVHDNPFYVDACLDDFECAAIQKRVYFNAMLEAVDHEIGKLISEIDEAKRLNLTVLVISDNGSPSDLIDPPHDPDHGKLRMYELGVRVPMIAAGPVVPSGQHVTSGLAHVVDVWRTLADLTGADETRLSPVPVLDSYSFMDLLEHPETGITTRAEVFCEAFRNPGRYEATAYGPYEEGCVSDPPDPCDVRVLFSHGRSLRSLGLQTGDGRYKLIRVLAADGVDGVPTDTPPVYTEEFYDLFSDKGEETDLAPSMPPPSDPCTTPECVAFRALQLRMTELSGF